MRFAFDASPGFCCFFIGVLGRFQGVGASAPSVIHWRMTASSAEVTVTCPVGGITWALQAVPEQPAPDAWPDAFR
jgi:hypothetical protein